MVDLLMMFSVVPLLFVLCLRLLSCVLPGVLQDKLINVLARGPENLNLWAYLEHRRQHAARPWRVLERLDKKAQPAAADAPKHSIELC